MAELDALESWAGALLSKLAPAARRSALREIARELQRSQRTRIAQQRNWTRLALAYVSERRASLLSALKQSVALRAFPIIIKPSTCSRTQRVGRFSQ